MRIIAYTLDILGKVMIAYTVLAVHSRIRKEQKIDREVFLKMRQEKYIVIGGVVLMVAGYILHIL